MIMLQLLLIIINVVLKGKHPYSTKPWADKLAQGYSSFQ